MKIRIITALAVAAIFAVSAPVFAQNQAQGKPPETKAEPKTEPKATPASVAGRWNVSINTGSDMRSVLTITTDPKDPKKIGGSITSPQGTDAPIDGTVVDGKLTFSLAIKSADGQDLKVTFVGGLQKDGALGGTLNFGQGDMAWTAVKEKKTRS